MRALDIAKTCLKRTTFPTKALAKAPKYQEQFCIKGVVISLGMRMAMRLLNLNT
ncbi:MAG: hypothetical protein NTW27_09605 [Deltaproteobacteria bacterium]|nr:hypothetical protein [Deltaproteobacteria bacterium]